MPMGIEWPEGAGGKTTQPAKQVWAAAASAAGADRVSYALLKEKNWRFGYTEHVAKVNEQLSTEHCEAVCKAGLEKLLSTFVFREADGSTKTLADLMETPVYVEAVSVAPAMCC